MFARWIPEVLHELMALSALPRPPDRPAILRARLCVVNEPMERRRPVVETFDVEGAVWIKLRYSGDPIVIVVVSSGGEMYTASP